MISKELITKILALSKMEDNKYAYQRLLNLLNSLTQNDLLELSKIIDYPVFNRICMGPLRHKFVLISSGSAVAIENDEHLVLMQKRSDNGLWGLPGGCQSPGETLKETAVREVKEETSLIIKPEDLVFIDILSGERILVYPNGDTNFCNTALFYTTKFTGNIEIDHESTDMKFLNPENIPREERCENDLIDTYINFSRKRSLK